MKFTLTITMGNDTMQTREDIAGALVKIAGQVELRDSLPIIDDNGQPVGKWEFTGEGS